MKPGRSGIGLLLAGTILATSASFAGAWTYSTEEVDYEGGSFVIGTRTGQYYMYRVGVATNDSVEPETLNVELNYHNGYIGQYWYSIDDGANWLEVPKNQATLSVENVAINDSVQLRAVICYYRYLSTSPWGEADESIGDEYYFAFPPGGHYWEGETVNPTGFVAVISLSPADAWTYSTDEVDYVGGSHIIGTRSGQTYMFRVGVATNDSGAQETLNVELNYHNGFIGQYWYSVDDGENWIDVPKNQTTFSVENVASGDSVQLRAVTCYYRYLSTSPWGEADESIGDEYYFAFPPGGHYWEGETVNPTGFVAVTSYTGPEEDLDQDGQTVSEGDCNDLDDTIYTGAPEVCGDGIDQDCDGEDESCVIETVTSAGLVWMDRNLGAYRAAASMDDEWAFGDYYQWGRGTDGHEQDDSATTTVLSNSDYPGHGDFITTDSEPHDWKTSQNDNLWQGESGINNPCPSGFRLPTETEFSVERASWTFGMDTFHNEAAYASPLRLIGAGRREWDGTFGPGTYWGCYWTSTVNGSSAKYFDFNPGWSTTYDQDRSLGMSVRCIQDYDLGDDLDQDGQTVSEGDCNDLDDSIYTGAPEICEDGIDQNCEGWDEPCGLPEGTVFSAGQIWIDRNLGASRVATSSDDAEAYGDLYQWGRLTDGHESRTSLTTSVISNTDVPGHDNFITVDSGTNDWRSPQNGDLWESESGTNNPCPSGFRLPTVTEIEVEINSWVTDNTAGAYSSPLKLVAAGRRNAPNGNISDEGIYGEYWSGTDSATSWFADIMYFRIGYAGSLSRERGNGLSVRCIMD